MNFHASEDGGERKSALVDVPVQIFSGNIWYEEVRKVVKEDYLAIYLNGEKRVSIACAGIHREELAVGWLRSEGLIESAGDLESLATGSDGRSVHVRTSEMKGGAGRSGDAAVASSGARSGAGDRLGGEMSPLPLGGETLSPAQIFSSMQSLLKAADLHNVSRGTHSAALADATRIIAVREDIGRHNCLDMLSGYCLLRNIDTADKFLFRTGRVSSEIVHKVWRMGVPVALSVSVPTALAVEMAEKAGITLVGAIRAPSLTVYTHMQRIGKT